MAERSDRQSRGSGARLSQCSRTFCWFGPYARFDGIQRACFRTALCAALLAPTATFAAEFRTPLDTPLTLPFEVLATNAVAGVSPPPGGGWLVGDVNATSAHAGRVVVRTALRWEAALPVSASGGLAAMALTEQGDVVVAGRGQPRVFSGGLVVASFHPDGTARWTNWVGTPREFPHGLAVDTEGNTYLAGSSSVPLGGFSAGWGSDMVVWKHDRAGRLLWTRTYHGTDRSVWPAAIAVTPTGTVLVVGTSATQTDPAVPSILLLEYSTDGMPIRTNQLGTGLFGALAFDDSGYLTVANDRGSTFQLGSDGFPRWIATNGPPSIGTITFDSSGNTFVAGSAPTDDSRPAWSFYKYNSSIFPGNPNLPTSGRAIGPGFPPVGWKPEILWARWWTEFGIAPIGSPIAVARGSDDSLTFAGAATIRGGQASVLVQIHPLTGFTAWARQYATPGRTEGTVYSEPHVLIRDRANHLYLAGAEALPGTLSNLLTVVKVAPHGEAIWTNRLESPSSLGSRSRIAVDAVGNLYQAAMRGDSLVVVKWGQEVVYTPPPGFLGTDSLGYWAVGAPSSAGAAAAVISVVPRNNPPFVRQPIAPPAAIVGLPFRLVLPADAFADPDPDQYLTLTVSDLPPWLSFHPANQTLSGIPDRTDPISVTVTATDNGRPPMRVSTVLTLAPEPFRITRQPAPQETLFASPARFSVAATPEAGLTYQWRKDGVPIPGATNATLEVPQATFLREGNYDVRIENSMGRITSDCVPLRVMSPPFIETHPRSAFIEDRPAIVTLWARIEGSRPMSFQWFRNQEPLTQPATTEGIASLAVAQVALTNPPADGTTSYWLQLSNRFGVARSAAARVLPAHALPATAPRLRLESLDDGPPALSWTPAAPGTASFVLESCDRLPSWGQWSMVPPSRVRLGTPQGRPRDVLAVDLRPLGSGSERYYRLRQVDDLGPAVLAFPVDEASPFDILELGTVPGLTNGPARIHFFSSAALGLTPDFSLPAVSLTPLRVVAPTPFRPMSDCCEGGSYHAELVMPDGRVLPIHGKLRVRPRPRPLSGKPAGSPTLAFLTTLERELRNAEPDLIERSRGGTNALVALDHWSRMIDQLAVLHRQVEHLIGHADAVVPLGSLPAADGLHFVTLNAASLSHLDQLLRDLFGSLREATETAGAASARVPAALHAGVANADHDEQFILSGEWFHGFNQELSKGILDVTARFGTSFNNALTIIGAGAYLLGGAAAAAQAAPVLAAIGAISFFATTVLPATTGILFKAVDHSAEDPLTYREVQPELNHLVKQVITQGTTLYADHALKPFLESELWILTKRLSPGAKVLFDPELPQAIAHLATGFESGKDPIGEPLANFFLPPDDPIWVNHGCAPGETPKVIDFNTKESWCSPDPVDPGEYVEWSIYDYRFSQRKPVCEIMGGNGLGLSILTIEAEGYLPATAEHDLIRGTLQINVSKVVPLDRPLAKADSFPIVAYSQATFQGEHGFFADPHPPILHGSLRYELRYGYVVGTFEFTLITADYYSPPHQTEPQELARTPVRGVFRFRPSPGVIFEPYCQHPGWPSTASVGAFPAAGLGPFRRPRDFLSLGWGMPSES